MHTHLTTPMDMPYSPHACMLCLQMQCTDSLHAHAHASSHTSRNSSGYDSAAQISPPLGIVLSSMLSRSRSCPQVHVVSPRLSLQRHCMLGWSLVGVVVKVDLACSASSAAGYLTGTSKGYVLICGALSNCEQTAQAIPVVLQL